MPTDDTSINDHALQVISNVIDGPMDIVRAVGAGRLHHQYIPDAVLLDRFAIDPATERALEAKGHKLQRMEQWGDASIRARGGRGSVGARPDRSDLPAHAPREADRSPVV